jgi:hypothetical protein
MRVALIPPGELTHTIVGHALNMISPEGLRTSEPYRDYYRREGKNPLVTTMLDNGAFEAVGGSTDLSFEQLHDTIDEYSVQMFCLPDVMGSMQRTIEEAKKFLHMWEMQHALVTPPPLQFVAIVQGSTKLELRECFFHYLQMEEEFQMTFVIGLPRWITEEISRSARVRLADRIMNRAPHAIHLLGLSRTWPAEIRYFNNRSTLSIDTSAPYVWAMAGQSLDKTTGRGKVGMRVENYFTHDCRNVDADLVKDNIDTLWSWANG